MKIEKLKDDLVKTQSEYIQELKNMIELKDKYIEVLERSLDIQDNHIAKQNEMIDEIKQLQKILVDDYNRLQSYHILNKK
jgi:uncharacterized protein (DUF3084 family)